MPNSDSVLTAYVGLHLTVCTRRLVWRVLADGEHGLAGDAPFG